MWAIGRLRVDHAGMAALNKQYSENVMTMHPRLDAALRRLSSALDQLEAAAERRTGLDRARADLEEELAVMQDDRARLAAELDGSLSRMRGLALANEDVAQRLERAEALLRGVIETDGGPRANARPQQAGDF